MIRLFTLQLLLLCGLSLEGQNLVINEFMASNDSLTLIVDDFGESDDWVELYNGTSTALDLGGFYLSDDFLEPDKWSFPFGIFIEADGYLIVWTDNDDEQGDLHTSYKLSAAGEEIMLSDANLGLIDSVSFGQQETNIPMARVPNGTGPFVQQVATFNANNGTMVNLEEAVRIQSLKAFPNPAADFLQVNIEFEEKATNFSLDLISASGTIVFQHNVDRPELKTQTTINVETFPSGIYWLVIKSGKSTIARPIEVLR